MQNLFAMGDDDMEEEPDLDEEDDGFYDHLSNEDSEAQVINTTDHQPKIVSRTGSEKWAHGKVSGVNSKLPGG